MLGANDHTIRMAFDALRLYPGVTMHIQSLSQSDSSHTRHKVQFIGIIKGKSLLVTLPFEDGKGMWMQAGQSFAVRGFNGIYAYGFSAQVIRPRSHPFPYIHFSWPRDVGCQLVRKSLRVEVSLPAKVTLPDNSTVAVTMLDISAPGSMLDSTSSLGAPGDTAKIGFSVYFEGNTTQMNMDVVIRNVQKKQIGSGFCIGVSFENMAKNDELILHYFFKYMATGVNT